MMILELLGKLLEFMIIQFNFCVLFQLPPFLGVVVFFLFLILFYFLINFVVFIFCIFSFFLLHSFIFFICTPFFIFYFFLTSYFFNKFYAVQAFSFNNTFLILAHHLKHVRRLKKGILNPYWMNIEFYRIFLFFFIYAVQE